jgi:excinuclease UvrABC ATPase subunit
MNECSKCQQGFIRITLEDGKTIVVPCDYCQGYSDHEDIAK